MPRSLILLNISFMIIGVESMDTWKKTWQMHTCFHWNSVFSGNLPWCCYNGPLKSNVSLPGSPLRTCIGQVHVQGWEPGNNASMYWKILHKYEKYYWTWNSLLLWGSSGNQSEMWWSKVTHCILENILEKKVAYDQLPKISSYTKGPHFNQ